ncbi:MAG: MarR family transcriptional regulator [Deltaproteobacteria bacterium]|nr:MarR family transcriptional regulator [Deltaproteobacteria bacterium]
MDDPKRIEALQSFAEDFGILFERFGIPRMAGRIMGWLIVCDPPEQSAAQLAEVLGVSKGSISTATRLLLAQGALERVGVLGQRGKFYRFPKDPASLLHSEVKIMDAFIRLAERGLEIIDDRPPRQKDRLEGFLGLWRFFQEEMPRLIERFEATKKKTKSGRRQK